MTMACPLVRRQTAYSDEVCRSKAMATQGMVGRKRGMASRRASERHRDHRFQLNSTFRYMVAMASN
jgi:hypothetical protein